MTELREPMIQCSLAAALEAMGERWSFLILRAAFNRLQHLKDFQSALGIARNILANRLARLVDARDRRPIEPVRVLSHDGRVLGKGDLIWALPDDVARYPDQAVAAE